MKTIILIVLIFTVMYSIDASAQMVNYKRRNKIMKVRPVENTQKNKYSKVSQKKAKIQALDEIEVKETLQQARELNRIERIYDMDQDGILGQSEISDFYKDVVSSVNRKGDFNITSDLLKVFDNNKDGKISKNETDKLQEAIN